MRRKLNELSDHLNPVFVRESRRIRNLPLLQGWYLLMLAGVAIGFVLLLTNCPNPRERKKIAPLYCLVCCQTLALSCCIPVPLVAFQMGHDDSLEETFETLTVTTLSTWQIFLGKVHAGMLYPLLHAAAVLPFLLASFLLGNLPLLHLVVLLLLHISAGYALCGLGVGAGIEPAFSLLIALCYGLISLLVLCGLFVVSSLLLVSSSVDWMLSLGLAFVISLGWFLGLAIGYHCTINRIG